MLTKSQVTEFMRNVVMDHMSYNGKNRSRLSGDQWLEVYLLADGFGTIGRQFAIEQSCDWSHVRDSSPIGIARMYAKVLELEQQWQRRAQSAG